MSHNPKSLLDFMTPFIKSTTPAGYKKLEMSIDRYIDINSSILTDNSPAKNMVFSKNDEKVIFDYLGMEDTDVAAFTKVIKASPDIKMKALAKPFTLASYLCFRNFYISGKKEEAEKIMLYMNLLFYSSVQYEYFKYGAQQVVMDYTINNLSNKFKYKTLKNNYNVLKDTYDTVIDTYDKEIKLGTDESINIVIPQLENRLNKIIKNVAILFYQNRAEKKYLNINKETMTDEEGNEDYVDAETTSSLIAGYTEAGVYAVMSTRPHVELVKRLAERNDIPFKNLLAIIESIQDNVRQEHLEEFYSSIFQSVAEMNIRVIGNVCSREFSYEAIRIISIPNTESRALLRLKNLLETFLIDLSPAYVNTQRSATKSNYRTATYTYLLYIFIMNKCG
jgi:hypothetical protein